MSTLNASFDLPPTPLAPSLARDVVSRIMAGWGIDERHDDAVLLVSEVVTNAVDHVGGDASFELALSHSDHSLRVAVSDGSAELPKAMAADLGAEGGRGVALVSALSDRWGSESYRGGKRVWFELDLPVSLANR